MAADQEKNKTAAASGKKYQKSYFDVMGICCSSEVPMIENILKPLDGVKEISVIVASRTVIVVHDNLLISQLQIVKALNQARLEANIRAYGESNFQKKWPSPYAIACGILLLLSLLKYVYKPFQWLALCAVAVGIFPIALRGLTAIRNFRLDINILMLIAVVGTIALNDYLEAGTIVFLFTIAEWLESRASHKATAVMTSLMSIAPQKAVIAETGEVVDADEVKVNTVLVVKAGEVIPIDGIVVDGKCEVDEKTLTGESFPVAKQKDSTVWAGTINLNGYVTVKTTEIAEDCVVAKMAKMVEEAQNNKSKAQRFIDRCAQYYTPAVVIISACFAAIPAAMRLHNLNQWFHLALVILVSACPCALILSTPVATFCALSKAATSGLLIKGGDYLEVLAKIKVMAFDKTGTITRGEFIISDFRPLCDEISLNTLLYWVSSIESKSSHPMAVALVDYGRSVSIEPKPEKVEEYQNFPGEGIYGKIDGKDIFIGNRKIAQRAGCETVPTSEDNTKQGKTIGYIYSGATPAGIFSLSDACRTGVADAIKELKLLGIKSVMLTGDSNAAALHAQELLGNALDVVHSELLPEDKAAIIKRFKEGPTAMVGDGLNDGPALATADVGISMGISGSALATETGNIILMSNDIRKIPKAVKLARNAHRKVIQNVILSITTKVAILALAFTGHPLIWAAVLADVGTCLLVILNSMLLLQETHKHGGKCSKSSATSHNHKHGCHTRNSHTSHAHQHCCSNRNTTKACEPQNCTAQRCGSSSQCDHCGSRSCENDMCTDAVEMHDGCVDDFHEAKYNHKHGCHTSNSHSFHAHQHCCSNRNAEKACEPQNCTAQRCGSSRQYGHFGSRLCENDKCTDSVERHDGCVGDFHEARHSEHGSCNMINHDMELCHLHKHGCSDPLIMSSCTKDKYTDFIEGQGNCVEDGGLGEGKHSNHGGCVKVTTHDLVSHSRPKHINHSTTLGENHSVSQPITHNSHCPLAHCGENKFKNYINNKAVGKTVESCCNNQEKNLEVHCGFKNHDTDNNEEPHTMIDIVLGSNRVESSAMHACMNLEKREIGGCCKSYRKECCGEHGHLGAGFGGGGLSEIITE